MGKAVQISQEGGGMAEKDLYLSWLNDAYAMEKNVEEVLERHADQAKEFPTIQSAIEEHLEVTRSQAERVKACIERNGGNVSSIKSGVANLTGAVAGAGSGMAKDRLVKNALTEYAAENFEIASYVALEVAAEEMGDMQTAQVCKEIIREEQEMTGWLEKNLRSISGYALQDSGH
jgi:ferritin-like metal-binding protein YciE